MRDKKRWKSLAAWALAFSMAMGNSGVMVMAESTDAEWAVEESVADYTEAQAETGSEEAEQSEVGVEEDAEETESESAIGTDAAQEENLSEAAVAEDTAAAESQSTVNAGADSEEASEFASEMETSGFTAGDEASAFISDSSDTTDELATFTDENGDEDDGEEDGEDDDEEQEGYFFDIDWPENNYQMLTGSSELITVKLGYKWENEDGEYRTNYKKNYRVELNEDDENPAFDENLIKSVGFYDSDDEYFKMWNVSIRSKNQESESAEVRLKAVSELTGEVLAETTIYFTISDSYYKIIPAHLATPDVGSTVDLSKLQVVQVEKNEESEEIQTEIENVEYRVENSDDNIWEIDDTPEGELPAIRRISPDGSSFRIAAYIENEEGGEERICERDFWLDEVEYHIYFMKDRNDCFTDEKRVIQLDKENLNGRNAYVDLQIGYTNNQEDWGADEGFTEFSENDPAKFWSIDSDSDDKYITITIDGAKLAAAYDGLSDECTIILRVLAMAKTGNGDEVVEVARKIAGLESREPIYDYRLDRYEENHIMVGHDVWVEQTGQCHVENGKLSEGGLPEGYDYEYQITSVEAGNAEGEGDTPVCVVKPMDEGWSVVAERTGTAILTINYTDIEGEEQSFNGQIYVDKDLYYLDIKYPDNDSRMVVNGTKDIDIKLYHQWAHSEDDQGYESVSNFTLKLLPDDNGNLFDENMITASVSMDETENWAAHIQAKSEAGWTTFRVQASIRDEDGSEIPVAEAEIEVDIQNVLYVIKGELPENIELGEYFDINDYKDKLKVMKYVDGEEPKEMTLLNLNVNWYQPDHDWETDAETGKMRRISSDGIGGSIWAGFEDPDEENSYDDVSREIFFENLDYWTWFEDLRQDEYSTFVYDDETYELTLNDKNLTDKKVKVQWEVGYYVGGEEEPPFNVIDDETTLGAFWSEDSEKPFSLIIDGKALRTAYERLSELVGEDKDCWIDVNARIVTDNKAEIEVIDKRSATISSREAWGEYNYQARSVQMLPGEEYALENTIGYYEENGTYPYGNSTELEIQDITLETEKGEEAPITLEKKDDHWLVTAKSMGHADAVIAYTDIDGNAATWRVEFYVTGSIYFVSTEAGNRDIWMLNGEELTVPVKAYVQELDENGKLKVTEVPESTYTLSLVDDEEFSYDRNLINEAKVEGNSLTVKADPNGWGNGEVRVYAASKEQENGEPVWDAYGQFYVNVQTAYYTVYPASLTENDQSIGAYESLDLNQYDLSVKFTETDKNGEKVTTNCENVRYILEYDKEQWECVKDSEELTVPILKRISAAPTWVNLIAQTSRVDAYGNTVWEDAANQIFSFERIVDWTCVHNWEVTKKVDATCTAAGSISYTCTKCGETKTDSIEKLSHNMVTVTDREATCGQPGKQHQECSLCGGERKDLPDLPVTGKHEWKVLKTTAATCTAEGSIEYICGVCRQTKSESIKKLAHNMVTVTDSEPTCGQSGKQHKACSLCNGEVTPLGDIPATGNHTWSAYVRTADPTAAAEGTEERTCSVCGTKETKAIAKLALFVKVASTSFPMKKSQSVSLTVTLEKGDKIQTVTSNNTKLVKASVKGNTVTLKAGKKATKGTVKITITTACGASQTITVKLQSSTVQAKKITGVSKTLTLKVKKSATLKPAVNPISCKTKVTYKSSNSKIASVSSKGVIKAKKTGTATITVTCGKVSVKCKVTVKKK